MMELTQTSIRNPLGTKPVIYHVLLLTLLALAAVLVSVNTAAQTNANPSAFNETFEALTRSSHRLTGTPEAAAARQVILDRLRAMGFDDAHLVEQPFKVVQAEVDRCELVINGQTIRLQPVRSNITTPPVTSDAGLTGRLIDGGKGRLSDYGDKPVSGSIVVLDYDSHDAWQTAFQLGAKAVIFRDNISGTDQTHLPVSEPKFAYMPGNLVRLYAVPGALDGIDFEAMPEATVFSHVVWRERRGVNIIAKVPGTEPKGQSLLDKSEALLLAADYDSFGQIPTRTPAAREAANVAALLDTAAVMQATPTVRDVYFVFFDATSHFHQGPRELYHAIYVPQVDHAELIVHHAAEKAAVTTMHEILEAFGPTFSSESLPDEATEDERSLLQLVSETAENANDDEMAAMQVIRLRRDRLIEEDAKLHATQIVSYNEALAQHQSRIDRLNLIRRAVHNLDMRGFIEGEGEIQAYWQQVEAFRAANPARAASDAFSETLPDIELPPYLARLSERDMERRLASSVGMSRTLERIWSRLNARLSRRLAELETEQVIDAGRSKVRRLFLVNAPTTSASSSPSSSSSTAIDEIDSRGFKPEFVWINAHVDFNFADGGTTWGPVADDWTFRLLQGRSPANDADRPGYNAGLLRAFSRAVADVKLADSSAEINAENRTLIEPTFGTTFAPSPFAVSGTIAGTYGIYRAALMTGYDARPRDGHPWDTAGELNIEAIQIQAAQATRVLRELANGRDLSEARRIKSQARHKHARWVSNRPEGDAINLQVSGSLSEARPASGAVMAILPAALDAKSPWVMHAKIGQVPAFDLSILETVNANGIMRTVGIRQDIHVDIAPLGILQNEFGEVRYTTTQRTLTSKRDQTLKTSLFPSRGYTFVAADRFRTNPDQFTIVRASSESRFRDTRVQQSAVGRFYYLYISDQIVDPRMRIFQQMGPVLLGIVNGDVTDREGGFPSDYLITPPQTGETTADELYQLNESRLTRLRRRGVTSADLEVFHNRAKRELVAAAAETEIAIKEAAFERSTSLSHRVYGPLRQSMDDLVYAIVMLLLLAIPFAFAMERLVICATTIYGRIGGFVSMFSLTFLLLYLMHPGFAIATTPIIIVLAFTILLLSVMVIYILIRKFDTEIKAIQGQSLGGEGAEVSKTGTMLAAVNMGMSTMRRRPTRTTLTAVTVVMLTFTILSFASFSRQMGVASIYQGPQNPDTTADVLLRNLDYSDIKLDVFNVIGDMAGEDGLLAVQWWKSKKTIDEPFQTVARADTGQHVMLDALMGVSAEEIKRWPALAQAAGGVDTSQADRVAALESGGVFLPELVGAQLNLQPGDPIMLNGVEATYAGPIDSQAMQRIRHLDGKTIIPVDFQNLAELQGGSAAQEDEDPLMVDDVERDFVNLSPDQIALTSPAMVKQLGGTPHIVSVYLSPGEDAIEAGNQFARLVVMPVWGVGPDGVERLVLKQLTSVSGGLQLVVPLVLGGLIIFGTLLGSISDREKEIYTFSALGLSPGNVGVLFFAEAAVYAVVGGMGGQLLAQTVALVASQLAAAGLIQPASINYSSTNSLFAIAVVMAVTIISAAYPAFRASKSANPGLARAWKMPPADGDVITTTFPFTVSAYDITGIISFIAETFRRHDDAGLGSYAASHVAISKTEAGNLRLEADLALAPFDLGVNQHLILTAVESEIPGVEEIAVEVRRISGTRGDWQRTNREFFKDLRQQFLVWRTLSAERIEAYRMMTFEALGEADEADKADNVNKVNEDQTETETMTTV